MSLALLVLAASAASAPAAVVARVEPEYPAWARGTGLSTRVALRVRVSADGHPARIEVVPYTTRRDVLTRSLRASFDSAAVRAVRQWRFRPAMRDGRPAAAWLQVEVPFDEAWTQTADPHPVMPDSIRSPALWDAIMGAWRRSPVRGTPVGHPSTLRFRSGGRYIALDSAGIASQGRFEISSDGSPSDPAALLVRIPDHGGRRRIDSLRFAGRDTLLLCPWRREGLCDTFVATARAARP